MENGVTQERDPMVVPQTVSQVLETFVAAMRADPAIPADAISRLETLLCKGAVPKPDEINAAMFETPPDGET